MNHVDALALMLVSGHACRQPDEVIGHPSDPYMLRWRLVYIKERGHIFLHNILRSDDDRALHDHPWPSTSIILSGTLREVLAEGESRLLEPGSITFRAAQTPHRLEVVEGPVWSLFMTGPWERDWGFYCGDRWVPWQEFVAPLHEGDEEGRGCA